MNNPHDPSEPTGFEVDLSEYDLPPTPGPFATDYPEGTFDPNYPAVPTGQAGEQDDQ